MSERIDDEPAFAELSAAHAVGALTPDEERTYREALDAHPEWQAIADDDVATAALLAETVPELAPPAAVRDRLMAQLDGPAGDAGSDAAVPDAVAPVAPASARPTASAPPRRWSRTLFALAASIVVVAVIGWGVLTRWGMPEPGPVTALSEIQAEPDAQVAEGEIAGGGEAEVHWSPSLGKVVLVADGLPDIDDGRTFELWFVRGDTPVSAGTFEVDGDTATALLDGAMEPGDVIAVTVESAGGSTTGQPTTDPILAVPTS